MNVDGTHHKTSFDAIMAWISSSGKLRGAGPPILAVAGALIWHYYRTVDWYKSNMVSHHVRTRGLGAERLAP
jgi:hypothetical protein